MREPTRSGLVFLLASQLTLLPVSAACLFTDYSVEGELGRSALVVVAEVVSERVVPVSDDSKTIGGVLYTIKVLEAFRGSAKPTTVVFSENSTGRFPMTVGQRYLLFLYEAAGRLSADYCGNSGLLSEKQAALTVLRTPKEGGP